jgi:hypothetical protein
MRHEHNPLDAVQIEEDQAQLEERKRRKRESWADALKFVMSDRRGRRFVLGLLEEAAVFNAVYAESHAAMSLMEGKRQVGLFIIDEAERECPNEFLRLLIEQRTNARSE